MYRSRTGTFRRGMKEIQAARAVANGATLGSTSSFIGKEFAVGAVYLVAGLAMLIYFEHEGRRTGSLDRN